MAPKSDPQIGVSVDSGDRIVGAGCKDGNAKYAVPLVDSDGHLQVDVLSNSTQYADGAARGTSAGTLAMIDDGTNIQSLKGDSSGRPAMNIEQVAGTNAMSGSGTATGALRVELPTNGTGVVGLNAGTNAIGKLAANSGVDIGDVDVTSTVTPVPTTSGGCLVANFNSGDTYTALTATAQAVKASAGQLYGYYIYNPNSSATYVLLYNIAAGSVTVGTSTAQMVFCIPATSGANLDLTHGIPFTNAGWSIAATTTGGGNTAPATALEAMVFYK